MPALRRPPPKSVTDRVCDWLMRNRAWTAAFVAFFGTGAVLYLGSRTFDNKKRRARRAGNGARKEIVGTSPMTTDGVYESLIIYQSSPDLRMSL